MNFKLVDFNGEITDDKILKCQELNNDIIFLKYDVLENDVLMLKENEIAVLINDGHICDYKEKAQTYMVMKTDEEIENDDICIRNAENNELCVVFFNKNIIKNNKLLINKLHVDKKINVSIEYDFKIENFKNFLNKIIGLRKLYTKQEIIEKVREHVTNSIKTRIINELEEYNLDIEKLLQVNKNIEDINEYDTKLLEYGVKLISYKITDYETIDKKFKFF